MIQAVCSEGVCCPPYLHALFLVHARCLSVPGQLPRTAQITSPGPSTRRKFAKFQACLCRWVFVCHVLSLVLELAGMAVMFLEIASRAKHPHKGEGSSRADHIAIMVVSLCTTLATFVLTMLGAGSSLARLRVVAKRISGTGTNMFRSRGTSVAGSTSKVEPLATAVDAETFPAH